MNLSMDNPICQKCYEIYGQPQGVEKTIYDNLPETTQTFCQGLTNERHKFWGDMTVSSYTMTPMMDVCIFRLEMLLWSRGK